MDKLMIETQNLILRINRRHLQTSMISVFSLSTRLAFSAANKNAIITFHKTI